MSASARVLRCQRLFSLNRGFVPRYCVCACALVSSLSYPSSEARFLYLGGLFVWPCSMLLWHMALKLDGNAANLARTFYRACAAKGAPSVGPQLLDIRPKGLKKPALSEAPPVWALV